MKEMSEGGVRTIISTGIGAVVTSLLLVVLELSVGCALANDPDLARIGPASSEAGLQGVAKLAHGAGIAMSSLTSVPIALCLCFFIYMLYMRWLSSGLNLFQGFPAQSRSHISLDDRQGRLKDTYKRLVWQPQKHKKAIVL